MARAVTVTIEEKIRGLALSYARDLKSSIDTRLREMESDDRSHFLIYQVLGVVRDAAWKYVKDRTGVDLRRILKKLAKENAPRT